MPAPTAPATTACHRPIVMAASGVLLDYRTPGNRRTAAGRHPSKTAINTVGGVRGLRVSGGSRMSPRPRRRTWFVQLLGIWAIVVMPALVFTQGSGQSSTTTQGPPQQTVPPPLPAPPPPPTMVVRSQSGERVFVDVVGGVFAMLGAGGGRGGGRNIADMSMPVPPDNPLTEARISLGRRLFNEKLLSN